MRLEGRQTGWFTRDIELKLNDQSIGTIRPKWFSEGYDLELLKKPVRFEKPSWMKSHFVLKDAAGIELGSATLEGFFGNRWRMNLSSGVGYLERTSMFGSEYVLKQDQSITARVNLTGWFSRNWDVTGNETLSAVDILLVGLVYSVIRHRAHQQQHAG
jgi:hypothetical protein